MVKRISIILLLLLVSIMSRVNAMTIVLDPGHGGSDSGAVNGSTYEKDVTLKIARYLKEYLEQYQNVKVILTHNGLSSGELMVFERSMIARNNKADLMVSLHINSSTSTEPKGAEVYVTANTSLPKYNQKTTELANRILKKFASIGISNRGVITKLIPLDTTDVYSDGTRADYMGIIRYAMRGTMIDSGRVTVIKDGQKVDVPASTSAIVEKGEGVPAILVEHCFIKGTDYQYIDTDEDIKKMAQLEGEAIVEHYGLTKTMIQIDEKTNTIKALPDVTIDQLVKELKATSYSILNLEGKTLEKKDEIIATGYKIKVQEKTYTLVKMGDINGDGKVLATDALAILKHSTGKNKLEGNFLLAADVKKDDKILATDALAVLKCSTGAEKISFN